MLKIVAEQTDNDLFQVLDSANPRGFEDAQGSITLKNLVPKAGSSISMLGENEPLQWAQRGEDVEIRLPSHLIGHYAYVLKMNNPKL